MDALLWIAQIALAAAFLACGTMKIFAYDRLIARMEARPQRQHPLSRGMSALVGILEIAGAVGVLLPAILLPGNLAEDYLLVRAAAGWLALLMIASGIYHLTRREPAAPAVSLFLLALFVLVGRWPH